MVDTNEVTDSLFNSYCDAEMHETPSTRVQDTDCLYLPPKLPVVTTESLLPCYVAHGPVSICTEPAGHKVYRSGWDLEPSSGPMVRYLLCFPGFCCLG